MTTSSYPELADMGRQEAARILDAAIPSLVEYFTTHLGDEDLDPQLVRDAIFWAEWQTLTELIEVVSKYPRKHITRFEFDRHYQAAVHRNFVWWRYRLCRGQIEPFTTKNRVKWHRQRVTEQTLDVGDDVVTLLLNKTGGPL